MIHKTQHVLMSDFSQEEFDEMMLTEMPEGGLSWYHENEDSYYEIGDATIFLKRCILILQNSEEYTKKYSLEQLNGFFWAMDGIDSMFFYFNHENVTQEAKMQFVIAAEQFFFSVIKHSKVYEMPNGFYMFPDILAGAVNNDFEFEKQFKKPLEINFGSLAEKSNSLQLHSKWYNQQNSEKQELLDKAYAFFKACVESKDNRLRYYGLHGMGHLYHPQKIKYIDNLIQNEKSMKNDTLQYLQKCQFSCIM